MTPPRPPIRSLRSRSRSAVAVLLAAAVVGACSSSDDDTIEPPEVSIDETVTTTTDASTTTAATTTPDASTTTTTATTLPRGEIEVAIEPATIWMTPPSGVDRDRICSPAEPAVAVLTVPAILDAAGARARVTSPGGRIRTIDLVETDDGGWRTPIGPLPATRASSDLQLLVEVEVELASGAAVTGRAELEALAPLPCASGQRRPTPTTPATALEVRTDPGDGVFVATGVADCAARPTSVELQARTRGNVVAVEASARLPDGRTLQRAFRGGPNLWRLGLGDIGGRPDMPETSVVPVTVVATDTLGATVTSSVFVTLARPVPCDGATTAPGTSTTTPADVPLRARVSASSTELYAQVTGGCPPGATSVVITAETTGSVRSAVVESITANGDTASWPMREASSGRWTVTVGPIPGVPSMPATSNLGVRLTVTGVDGSTVVEQSRLTLRRPPRCATSTTTTTTPGGPTTTQAPTTTQPPTTTQAPTTTQPPTTTQAPTTTQPPTTTTEPLTIEALAPQPSAIDAQVTGSCPTRPLTFQVSARTTGAVNNVGVRIEVGPATVNLPMSGGSGSWSATVGPIPGAPSMPASAVISITVAANGPGGTVTDTTSATLFRPQPPPCP
jgi:hypothetical protein